MDKCLIIARYNEDLEWLKEFKDFKIIVYNKGDELSEKRFYEVINLENKGRESHTWLYHIVKNYNNLNEINIFLQGRIDDLNCMAFSNPSDYLNDINKYGFKASRYGVLGPLHWKWHVGIENNKKYKQNWDNFEISRSNIGFRKYAENLFPTIPRIIATSYGGCFAIKKELIRKYDLDFYLELLKSLSYHKNPIEGHFMERLWCYMFTENKNLSQAILDVIKTKIERSKLYKLNKII